MLPGGHAIELEAEPTNAYDPNAVKVVIPFSEFAQAALDEIAKEPQEGWQALTFPFHVGYVPKELAKMLVESGEFETKGYLAFDMQGRPTFEPQVEKTESPGVEADPTKTPDFSKELDDEIPF
jgi:hypothetical protein